MDVINRKFQQRYRQDNRRHPRGGHKYGRFSCLWYKRQEENDAGLKKTLEQTC